MEQPATTTINTAHKQKEKQIKARAHKERTTQEYYSDCQFDEGVSSFTGFMQSQFTQHNMFVVQSAYTSESTFHFYNKGEYQWR